MGHDEELAAIEAAEMSRAAKVVAQQAAFVQRVLEARAAAMAQRAGLTVRQFAGLSALSKSEAGRLLKSAPMGYASNPEYKAVIEDLYQVVANRVQASPASPVIPATNERGRPRSGPRFAAGAAIIGLILTALLVAGHTTRPIAGQGAPVLPVFPYRHMTIQTNPGAGVPSVFVTIDDGAAVTTSSVGRDVPADGTPTHDAAWTNPAACERVHGHPGVCWRYWQQVGTEVRVWTTFHGRSCVIIGSTAGRQTRVICDGTTT